MKMSKRVLWLLLWCSALSAGSAWAHDRGHGPRVGVYVGVPFAYPWYALPPYYSPYYYPPYYYYPPQVIVRPEPPVYIERAAPPAAAQPEAGSRSQGYWYYCGNPQGYYPYIKECPAGWQQVVPTPPPN